MKITDIQALEVLDSRGFPTVEVWLRVEKGFGQAIVPSGASTGSREALELRDGGERYNGKGVLKVIENINSIKGSLIGLEFTQETLDHALCELDGTPNKSKLGANTLLGISMAFAKARAYAEQKYLFAALGNDEPLMPIPFMNVLNGGAHADNSVDIQEFMIAPIGASDFREAIRMGVEVYHSLKSALKADGMATSIGDEGGFAPNLPSNRAALEYLTRAIELVGLEPGRDVALALDVAASELYRDGKYVLDGKAHLTHEWIEVLSSWHSEFDLISVEDAMAEDDWQGWIELTRALGDRLQLVGDDLFVTQSQYLRRGIDERAANAILIKLNQVGTVTETLETIDTARSRNFGQMISHRSGETEDTFIADLAVATRAGQIKTGAPARSERCAKYNQLLRIFHQFNPPYARWQDVKGN